VSPIMDRFGRSFRRLLEDYRCTLNTTQ